jgi:hypothetical protein
MFDFTMLDQKDFCLCSLIYESLDSGTSERLALRHSKSEINHFCLFLDCGYKKPTHLGLGQGVEGKEDDDESTKANPTRMGSIFELFVIEFLGSFHSFRPRARHAHSLAHSLSPEKGFDVILVEHKTCLHKFPKKY